MKLSQIKNRIPKELYEVLSKELKELRPCQVKSIKAGVLEGKNLLVCSPTASGKTLVAELAGLKTILENKRKVVYIVPLKALANEKFKDFKRRYGHLIRIALSIGDFDSSDPFLIDYDLIICSVEKLDSLIRHKAPWLSLVKVVVVDETHLINDPERGPTLEILITLLRDILKDVQIIALSATIGNTKELASWLDANLVEDSWRPVKLYKGIYLSGEVEFKKEK